MRVVVGEVRPLLLVGLRLGQQTLEESGRSGVFSRAGCGWYGVRRGDLRRGAGRSDHDQTLVASRTLRWPSTAESTGQTVSLIWIWLVDATSQSAGT